ncbi:dipeptidase PepE [Rheinheimera sp. 4Y26]|uniref:dipeptidase PepE n=1 Tax=Rheinheimera sp. 4Y26 TaxID=2977811 RepID=UPI0021B0C64A|nr:dipeptidase PepE [Rheinheimera sp. 4Y26]MCT6700748.1 dipeptidase PepE [Rheinheimera sp. 4Y26]
MKLLLLSSSRAGNSAYLAPNLAQIASHLQGVSTVLFIPYAAVSQGYDAYQQMVQQAFSAIDIQVDSIHQHPDPVAAVTQAQAIVVGGGNTFVLLQQLYRHGLIDSIRAQVNKGVPYVGWSAGSNIAGLSIRTTNDMPVVEPPSFTALDLVPLQLNPHYSDYKPEGFHGETRDMRLGEFMQLNPETAVIALPEGTALVRDGATLSYQGQTDGYLFIGGSKTALLPGADLSAFLQL